MKYKTTPEVDVPVTADVMRTMLSRVTTRDDELDKLPVNVLVPTVDAIDNDPADTADSDAADARSLFAANVTFVSAALLWMLRDRMTFRGTAVQTQLTLLA